MSLFRLVLSTRRPISQIALKAERPCFLKSTLAPQRTYASKAKAKATSTLVPGSKQPITDPAAQQEYSKAEAAMKTAIDWYRKECAAKETQASGRVIPAMLNPVRVKLPTSEKDFRLEELATVGVREGSTLLITLFDESVSFFCLPWPTCSPLGHVSTLKSHNWLGRT